MCHWAALATEEGGAGGANGKDHGGGHILAVNDVYGGTARMLSRTARPLGIETTFLNFEDAGEEGIRKALRPDTRVSHHSSLALPGFEKLMIRLFGSSAPPILSS
jgi:cystathionine gamma-lyase